MRRADPPGEHANGGHIQPRNYLRPCLLLLLGEEATYGYELREKLAPLSLGHWDPGTVYRTLNTMEDDGLVRSLWERSEEGPRRRRYEITTAGRHVLDDWARELCGMRDLIVDFIDRYQTDHGGSAPLARLPLRVAGRPGVTQPQEPAHGTALHVSPSATSPSSRR